MLTYIQHVESAMQDLQQGKMVILIDSPDRENEGDLIFPAEMATPEKINFMIRHCSGIICLSLDETFINKLGLKPMVPLDENTSHRKTPFTLSIEAKHGVSTGVSAHDRAKTILTAIDENSTPDDLVKPGHIFPLHAKKEGVLERAGHTEGAVDLVRLAGFKSAAVLCEIMNPDGSMARGKELKKFADTHQLKILSIEDLIHYRFYHETLIEEEVSATLPIKSYGAFEINVIKEKQTQHEHIILTKNFASSIPPLVRIHSCCITGDLFGSERCDCHQQLNYSLKKISQEGGILIYLNQEGRGIGLFNKIKAYALQEKGLDTIEANQKLGMPADAREYFLAANILRNRGIYHVRLLTNNPAKAEGLKKYGITIEYEKMPIFCSAHNKNYLYTKKMKLNHFINDEALLKEDVI
ncbi:MAG TPA: 3,4-dihydroxy-2-butanone-4-phosphate synthase [Gammaproteobacteria bacterium]|nr:3,4-dihydroxy-2-butanone-4-phosphate synthase [Gammaproteobacteria bacterium]